MTTRWSAYSEIVKLLSCSFLSGLSTNIKYSRGDSTAVWGQSSLWNNWQEVSLTLLISQLIQYLELHKSWFWCLFASVVLINFTAFWNSRDISEFIWYLNLKLIIIFYWIVVSLVFSNITQFFREKKERRVSELFEYFSWKLLPCESENYCRIQNAASTNHVGRKKTSTWNPL